MKLRQRMYRFFGAAAFALLALGSALFFIRRDGLGLLLVVFFVPCEVLARVLAPKGCP